MVNQDFKKQFQCYVVYSVQHFSVILLAIAKKRSSDSGLSNLPLVTVNCFILKNQKLVPKMQWCVP